MTDISGKTALVTGGGSGIGRATAIALAQQGAKVAVVDIHASAAAAVAQEIHAQGGIALAVECDISSRASILAMRETVHAGLGPVLIVFANAGVTAVDRLVDMTDDDVEWINRVNYDGAIYCIKAFLSDMIAAGEGHVLATSSLAGLLPGWIPDHAPYSGTKAGLIGFLLNLRAELARDSIGCTVVCPGGVATNIRNAAQNRPARFGGAGAMPVAAMEDFQEDQGLSFRPAEEAADMILDGIRRDAPLVITDGTRKQLFLDSYVALVLSAFDEAAAYRLG